jgi:hypothetical protein
MKKIAGSVSGSGSISQRHGFADPDPYQNVMDLQHCLQLSYLGEEVELDHGVGERVGIGAEVGNHAQHGAVEGPVDLLEARLPRVVHVHHRHVPQEPARQPYILYHPQGDY